jgi:hypothetical protein
VLVPDLIARGMSRSSLGGIVHGVTVTPGVKVAQGSVIVCRNEVKDAGDQTTPQKPMNESTNASGWWKQRMRTSSKKTFPDGTRSRMAGFPFCLLRPEYTSGLTNLRSFYFEV